MYILCSMMHATGRALGAAACCLALPWPSFARHHGQPTSQRQPGRPFFCFGHMASLGPMVVAGRACVASLSHRARIEGVSIGLTSAESPSSPSRRLPAPAGCGHR